MSKDNDEKVGSKSLSEKKHELVSHWSLVMLRDLEKKTANAIDTKEH